MTIDSFVTQVLNNLSQGTDVTSTQRTFFARLSSGKTGVHSPSTTSIDPH